MSKERGLIFTQSIDRLLDGTKTQSRRLPAWSNCLVDGRMASVSGWKELAWDTACSTDHFIWIKQGDKESWETVKITPRWQVGDEFYIKEAWAAGDDNEPPENIWYRADDSLRNSLGIALDTYAMVRPAEWRNAMFMPRLVARHQRFLVTDVLFERLQDISEEDARAEGVYFEFELNIADALGKSVNDLRALSTYRLGFKHLWNTIHKPPHDWASNPVVLVYTFERIGK